MSISSNSVGLDRALAISALIAGPRSAVT